MTEQTSTPRDVPQAVASLGAAAFLINLPWQMVWWRRVCGLPSQEPVVVRVAAIVMVSIVSAVCLLPFPAFGACLVLVAASR